MPPNTTGIGLLAQTAPKPAGKGTNLGFDAATKAGSTTQTYKEREGKGKQAFVVYLETADFENLAKLKQLSGAKSKKDVLVQALRDYAKTYQL